MINQIAPLQFKTQPLPKGTFNRNLAKARHIQARLHQHIPAPPTLEKPDRAIIWSPITAGPYVVPVLRWIE
jgi:hypothetical protein